MKLIDNYMSDINKIISEYRRIEKEMKHLLNEAGLLEQKKNLIELALVKNRDSEQALIDKIKTETGKEPNFLEILEQLKL